MYSITDLKAGTLIELFGEPYLVTEYQHTKLGRGSGVVKVKVRNLVTGAVLEKTFKGADKIKEALLSKKEAQFLYRNGNKFYFMDTKNYEQFSLSLAQIGAAVDFLKEGIILNILLFKGRAINIELPIKMDFKVIKAEPGIKGDRVEAGTKPVELETGLVIQVPLFVKKGDVIKVDTRNGNYIERIK